MPPEQLVLGFDTSAAHCAAALLSGDQVLAHAHEDMTKGQAERLFPLLQDLLAQAGASWSDLSGLGVGVGPGNFTGIRIAVSAARGLALSLNIPAMGVSAFDVLTFGNDRPILACVDARRGQSYAYCREYIAPPAVISPDAFPAELVDTGLACIGHQADIYTMMTGGPALAPQWPVAQAVARIAARRASPTAPRPAPLYIRGADAAPSADRPPVILP